MIAELLSAGATSERQAAEISDLMFIVDAVGRIGSRCGETAALYGERLSTKKPFSDEAREELAESAAMVSDMYDAVLRFLSDQDAASERVLDERRRAGLSILVISHDLEGMDDLCDTHRHLREVVLT